MHVAARGHGGQADFVDPLQHRAEILLGQAVHLQVLPARDPQRAVAIPVGKLDLGQKLLARQPAAGHSRADHELVDLFLGFLIAQVAQQHAAVAVILLIHAVMFQQLGRLGGEMVGRLRQLFGDLSAQVVAFRLDLLDRARRAVDRLLRIAAHDHGNLSRRMKTQCGPEPRTGNLSD